MRSELTASREPVTGQNLGNTHQTSVRRGFSLEVDVTERCNFGCAYCYKGPKRGNRDVAPAKLAGAIEMVWPRVAESGGLLLGFMGGEPLCAFDKIRGVVVGLEERCKRGGLHFEWGMTSNMSLFRAEHARFMRETNGGIYPSIDGDRVSHDTNRPFANGRPSFDAVMRGVGVLREHGMQNGARLTITPATIGSLAANLVFLAGQGFKAVAAFPAFGGEMVWEEGHFRTVREQARCIAEFRRDVLSGLESIHPFDAYAFTINHGAPQAEGLAHHCGACRTSLAMDVDGHLYPCHRFTSGGGFEVKDIGESWEAIKEHFEGSVSRACLACRAFGACRGGCWAENKATTGSLATPCEPHCAYNLALYDGIQESGYVCPGHNPPGILIAGENSCVTMDICVACDCNAPSCGSCDRQDRCNRCDVCDDCHRADICRHCDYRDRR